MLVLCRRKGEAVIIGDNIELIILGTKGAQIKLGFIAPSSIKIYRKEIYTRFIVAKDCLLNFISTDKVCSKKDAR